MAEWPSGLGKGLQSPVHGFDSRLRLTYWLKMPPEQAKLRAGPVRPMTRQQATAAPPRKSPLGLPPAREEPSRHPARRSRQARRIPGHILRQMMISEFCQWLRGRTNKHRRQFQEETITAYKVAARALDAWMTVGGIDGDFTACDTAVLNRFFRDYHAAHSRAARTPSSATCGTCSPGWTRSTTIPTRTPTG